MPFSSFGHFGLHVLAGLILLSSSVFATTPVPVFTSDTGEKYWSSSRHARGLEIFIGADHLILTHCASKTKLRVTELTAGADAFRVKGIIVSMIADDKQQTFQDVADRFNEPLYRSEITNIAANDSFCAGKT